MSIQIFRDIFIQLNSIKLASNYYNLIAELDRGEVSQKITTMPIYQCRNYFTIMVNYPQYSYDLLNSLQYPSFEEFSELYNIIVSDFYTEIIIFGEVNNKQAEELKIDEFSIKTKTQARVEIDLQSSLLRSHYAIDGAIAFRRVLPFENSSESGIVNYYQLGKLNVKDELILDIIEMLKENLFFNNLRTEKGLGYVAGSKIVYLDGVFVI